MTQEKKSNRYYFQDSWTGNAVCFATLKEAMKAAKKEYCNNVAIYDKNGFVCYAQGSGKQPQ